MTEIINFERKKNTLVKIPIILQSKLRTSQGHKVKPSKLKKSRVSETEPCFFLILQSVFLESFPCCILSLIFITGQLGIVPCLSRSCPFDFYQPLSLCSKRGENLFAAVTGLIILQLNKLLSWDSLLKWRKEKLHVWMLFFSCLPQHSCLTGTDAN